MDINRLPKHIAIIMDGNGRWAKERGLSRAEGHRCGAETIETIVEAASDIGIKYLTLYAFSEENWNRPEGEVKSLMELLSHYLASKRGKMVSEGIRFATIGDVKTLSAGLQDEIKKTMDATKSGNKMTLIVALSYGARQEICRAVRKLIIGAFSKPVRPERVPVHPSTSSGRTGTSRRAHLEREVLNNVTPEMFSYALDTAGIPDPDLLIRTSGEYRISNFLLWQLAYTELYFTEKLWPDFNRDELLRAIEEYQKRERRFGLISEQIHVSPSP